MSAGSHNSYRKVVVRTWKDERFRALSLSAKLIALYLMTAQSNRCGIFTFSPAMAVEDLNMAASAFGRAMRQVLESLEWWWDETVRVLYIPTWWKYNQPLSETHLKGCLSDLASLPQTELVPRFLDNAEHLDEFLREAFYRETSALRHRYAVSMGMAGVSDTHPYTHPPGYPDTHPGGHTHAQGDTHPHTPGTSVTVSRTVTRTGTVTGAGAEVSETATQRLVREFCAMIPDRRPSKRDFQVVGLLVRDHGEAAIADALRGRTRAKIVAADRPLQYLIGVVQKSAAAAGPQGPTVRDRMATHQAALDAMHEKPA